MEVYFAKDLFIDYFIVHNSARAIDALPRDKYVYMIQYNTQTASLGGWEEGRTISGGVKVIQ